MHGGSIPEGAAPGEGLWLTSALLAAVPGLRHGFTTRALGDFAAGGPGPSRLLTAAGAGRLRLLHQVHETRVVTPDDAEDLPAADGWRGRPAPGVLLAVRNADCLPILAYHDDTGECLALHAGWRGAVAGIIASGLSGLAGEPSGLRVALGPAIGACCYEVGEEVAHAARRHPQTLTAKGSGKYWFDLVAFAEADLLTLGVGPERIDRVTPCTRCDADRLYSHRREGHAGRMCAFIGFGD
jgi:YfiH family protein